MKPICVACERYMRLQKSGYYFTEGKPFGGPVEWDGKQGKHSVGWTPYKVWAGDLWTCPGCGFQGIFGVGINRVAEHYESDFREVMEGTGASQLFIKDC